MRKPDYGEIGCPWCKHDLVEHELNVTRALGKPGQPPPDSRIWDYEATRVQLGACGRAGCECRGTHPSNILRFVELMQEPLQPHPVVQSAIEAELQYVRAQMISRLMDHLSRSDREEIDRRAGETLREQLMGPGVRGVYHIPFPRRVEP